MVFRIWLDLALLLFASVSDPGAQALRFRSADLTIVMKVDPVRFVHNGVLRDRDRLIVGFTGVTRTVQYHITSTAGSLPRNLKVKEVLDVALQNYPSTNEILDERERIVPVAPDGMFSDVIALGVTGGYALPPDFRQIIRQRLYLFHDESYPTGRLLAILAIERRTTDITVKLFSPSPERR